MDDIYKHWIQLILLHQLFLIIEKDYKSCHENKWNKSFSSSPERFYLTEIIKLDPTTNACQTRLSIT